MRTTNELLQRLIDRKLTQEEISRRTDIPQPRLSKWINGKAPKSANDALKLKALVDSLDRRPRAAKAQG